MECLPSIYSEPQELALRYYRLLRRLSQQQVADQAGVRQPDLSLFEQGRMNPRADELKRLAAVLGISPPDVLLKPVKVVLDEVAES